MKEWIWWSHLMFLFFYIGPWRRGGGASDLLTSKPSRPGECLHDGVLCRRWGLLLCHYWGQELFLTMWPGPSHPHYSQNITPESEILEKMKDVLLSSFLRHPFKKQQFAQSHSSSWIMLQYLKLKHSYHYLDNAKLSGQHLGSQGVESYTTSGD